MDKTPAGNVTIAPQVLTTIVEQTALSTQGVRSLASRSPRMKSMEGRRAVGTGVEAVVQENTVFVAVSVKAAPDTNILVLAETLQHDIAGNIAHILDMTVARVDVYVGDVIFSEDVPK